VDAAFTYTWMSGKVLNELGIHPGGNCAVILRHGKLQFDFESLKTANYANSAEFVKSVG
jgi:hypothetical protein